MDANSQKLLDTMIARAEKEIGFKPEDSKLLVDLSKKEKLIYIFLHRSRNNRITTKFTI